MTINEWEQSNIEVLTSREMGEWLGRRENRLLDEIRAEIERERSFQRAMDEYDIATGLRKALEIIDKYKAESEDI